MGKYIRFTNLIFCFGLLFTLACSNVRNKSEIYSVIPTCNQNLFLEKYKVGGSGAHSGDVVSAYLTDSTNFRKFVHSYDNSHEKLTIECLGDDSIEVRISKRLSEANGYSLIKIIGFNLKGLKLKGDFE